MEKTIEDSLREISIFKGLSPQNLKRLSGEFQIREFKKAKPSSINQIIAQTFILS